MQEIWKPVSGYEGLYEVSNTGEVRRIPGFRCRKYRVLSKKITKDGYYETALCKDGKFKFIRTHRIVASTFCENYFNKPEVNHIDGNKLNNSADNLEWVTSSENQLHAYKTGLQKVSGGAILNKKPIECISLGIKKSGLFEMQRFLADNGYTSSRRLNRLSTLVSENGFNEFSYLGLKFKLIEKVE